MFVFTNIRLIVIQISITDWTGNQWATAFNDEAEKLFGLTAQEVGELKENDSDGYDNIFAKAAFSPHFFKLRAKKETFNVSSI